jgi:hypothetical protein
MVQRRGRQSRSVSRRRDSSRRRNPSSRYRAREVDSGLKNLQDKHDKLSRECEKLSREAGQFRDRKTERGGPVWPCACGFRTNFADRTHCHGCKKAKGDGKPPPPAQPSQRVKPAPVPLAAAAPPLPAAHLAASPGAALEAQRKDTSSRLVAMKQMASDHPTDTFVAEHVARLEGQLSALKEQIFALKPVAAQLQTALSQVASVDKKVLVAQELVKSSMAALVESQLALGTLLETQTALQADLARLKADGLEPPLSPGFIDLTVFLDFMKELSQMPAGGNVALLAQAAGRKFGILADMDVDDGTPAPAPAAPPPAGPKAQSGRSARDLSPMSSRGGSAGGRSRSPVRSAGPASRPDPKVWAGFSGGPFNTPLNVPDSQEPGGAGGTTPVAGEQEETPAATLARALLITSTAASSSSTAK